MTTTTPLLGTPEAFRRQCEIEWTAYPAIREEFGEFDTYYHFKKAEAEGRCRISSNVPIGRRTL